MTKQTLVGTTAVAVVALAAWSALRSDEGGTEPAPGKIYVRYLPDGAEAGDPRTGFDIVGTYPTVNAVGALRRARQRVGGRLGRTDDGAVLLIDPANDSSAHLAYPGSDLQIEVYGGKPGRALRLAARDEVQPVP